MNALKKLVDRMVDDIKDAPDDDGEPGFLYEVENLKLHTEDAEFVVKDAESGAAFTVIVKQGVRS